MTDDEFTSMVRYVFDVGLVVMGVKEMESSSGDEMRRMEARYEVEEEKRALYLEEAEGNKMTIREENLFDLDETEECTNVPEVNKIETEEENMIDLDGMEEYTKVPEGNKIQTEEENMIDLDGIEEYTKVPEGNKIQTEEENSIDLDETKKYIKGFSTGGTEEEGDLDLREPEGNEIQTEEENLIDLETGDCIKSSSDDNTDTQLPHSQVSSTLPELLVNLDESGESSSCLEFKQDLLELIEG